MEFQRLHDLKAFYNLLDEAKERSDWLRKLDDSSGGKNLPQRGVYFFKENGESRSHSGDGARVVRVGTHALTKTSNATLGQHPAPTARAVSLNETVLLS